MNAHEPKCFELSKEAMENVHGGAWYAKYVDPRYGSALNIDLCGTPWTPPKPFQFPTPVVPLAVPGGPTPPN